MANWRLELLLLEIAGSFHLEYNMYQLGHHRVLLIFKGLTAFNPGFTIYHDVDAAWLNGHAGFTESVIDD